MFPSGDESQIFNRDGQWSLPGNPTLAVKSEISRVALRLAVKSLSLAVKTLRLAVKSPRLAVVLPLPVCLLRSRSHLSVER